MAWEDFEITYLLAPFVFVFVVFLALLLHEMGHYAAARLFKMPVKSVVIGRGRTLKYWKDKHDTRWSIRLWPLGAYVHLSGIAGEEESAEAFARHPFWQRMMTILAGPLANFAVLPFLFFAFYMAVGQPSTPPILTGVEQGLVSDRAGLKPGDRILSVDGVPMTNTSDIWRVLYAKEVAESEIVIERGSKEITKTITPDWAEYMDDRGVPRKNARFGVVWQHAPFKLSAITSVNGVNTDEDDKRTRDMLIRNLGRSTVLGIKGPDGEEGLTNVVLSKDANRGLLDEQDEHYEHVFLGASRGNVYLQKPWQDNAHNALRYAGGMIKKVALVPFQLFPIDISAVKDEHAVTNPDTWLTNKFYSILHLFAVTCVVIALVNLLPFPHLDGGHILTQMIERVRGKSLPRKAKAKIFAAAFLVFYLSVMLANMDNVPHYIDSRVKKVHEFINNQIPDEEG